MHVCSRHTSLPAEQQQSPRICTCTERTRIRTHYLPSSSSRRAYAHAQSVLVYVHTTCRAAAVAAVDAHDDAGEDGQVAEEVAKA